MRHIRLLVITLLLSIASGFAQELAEGPEEQFEATPQQRQRWFYEQRAYPSRLTPPGAHFRAVEQFNSMRTAQAAALASGVTTNALGAWTQIGPQPADESAFGYGITSGRITAVAVDPTTSGANTTIYIGGAEGGVWKSTNNGSTWTPLTDSQPTLAIGSITIDPNDHNVIYVGTGEENFSGDSYYGGGILKSINGGANWTYLGTSAFGGPLSAGNGGSYIGGIAVQPGSATPVLLAATQYASATNGFGSGVYRSVDGGTSWTRTLGNSSSTAATSVFFVNNTTAYAAIGYLFGDASNGIYKSIDGGASWNPANGTVGNVVPSGSSTGRITLVSAPSNSNVLYAAVQSASTFGLRGLYKTTDGGANWSAITTPLGTGGGGSTSDFCGGQCWYDMPLAVSPTNANVLYAGGSFNYGAGNGGLYVTLTGGTSWATPNPGTNSVRMHPDFHAFAFSADGNTLYIGQDGGIWSGSPTNSNTMAWTDLNSGLAITEFYPGLSIAKANKNIALNGTQDNGTQLYSGALQWKVVACGDGAWTAIDPTNSNIMYTGCTSANSGPYRSTNGGTSWSLITTGLSQSGAAFIPTMVMDPNNPAVLYYGTKIVYKMSNANDTVGTPTWVSLSSTGLSGSPLTSIAVAIGNSNNIFTAAGGGGVHFSTNGGSTFTQASGLPTRFATMVQGDPVDASVFYATFSGFDGFGGTAGHVFKCSTGTGTCSNITGNLPNTPANDIVIDPTLANTLYVATDVGVFYTVNGGATWTTAGTGLPNVAVVGLKLHAASRTLRAATHGRSVWDLSVPTSSGAPATMTNPTPGSTLTSSSVTFTWTTGTNVTDYILYVGTAPGTKDIAGVDAHTSTSLTVKNIPTSGGTLYVTLYSKIAGVLQHNSYTYTELNLAPAAMTSPTPGSTLTGASATFHWTTGTNVTDYILYAGTTAGAKDIAGIDAHTATSATVSNIPTNGGTLYITLYSKIGGVLYHNSYIYTEFNGTPAAMTSPTPGTKLSGASVTFNWTAGTNVTDYILYLGTTAGAKDIAGIDAHTTTSATVNNIPTAGATLYVTLYSKIGGGLLHNSYTYTEAGP